MLDETMILPVFHTCSGVKLLETHRVASYNKVFHDLFRRRANDNLINLGYLCIQGGLLVISRVITPFLGL